MGIIQKKNLEDLIGDDDEDEQKFVLDDYHSDDDHHRPSDPDGFSPAVKELMLK